MAILPWRHPSHLDLETFDSDSSLFILKELCHVVDVLIADRKTHISQSNSLTCVCIDFQVAPVERVLAHVHVHVHAVHIEQWQEQVDAMWP